MVGTVPPVELARHEPKQASPRGNRGGTNHVVEGEGASWGISGEKNGQGTSGKLVQVAFACGSGVQRMYPNRLEGIASFGIIRTTANPRRNSATDAGRRPEQQLRTLRLGYGIRE